MSRSDAHLRTKPRVKNALARPISVAKKEALASAQFGEWVEAIGRVSLRKEMHERHSDIIIVGTEKYRCVVTKKLYPKSGSAPHVAKLKGPARHIVMWKGPAQHVGRVKGSTQHIVGLKGSASHVVGWRKDRTTRSVVVMYTLERVGPASSRESGRQQAAPAVSDAAFDPTPRTKAILKGVEIAQDDLRMSGGTFDEEQVRQLLQSESKFEIEKEVRDKKLLAVPGPHGRLRFPAIQFNEDGTVVGGLAAVQKALPTENGFAVLNFLIHRDSRLGNQSPIDYLKRGKIAPVVELARGFGEQGA
jgi:hypothetical protein